MCTVVHTNEINVHTDEMQFIGKSQNGAEDFQQCLLVLQGSLVGSGQTEPVNCLEPRLQEKWHRAILVVLESESNVGCLEFKNLLLPIFL